MSVSIDWDEIGTLRHISSDREIRTDPIWILLITALQGHEGWVEDMTIVMKRGQVYTTEDILRLAKLPDRKGSPKNQ